MQPFYTLTQPRTTLLDINPSLSLKLKTCPTAGNLFLQYIKSVYQLKVNVVFTIGYLFDGDL